MHELFCQKYAAARVGHKAECMPHAVARIDASHSDAVVVVMEGHDDEFIPHLLVVVHADEVTRLCKYNSSYT